MANVVEIVLRAVDKTKQGFTTPIKNLNDLGTALGKLTPAFATLATLAASSFGVMASHAISTADEMGKMAQKAGTSTEAFSANAYAADLAGLSSDKLVKVYRELGATMIEAAKEGTVQSQLFQSIGISATDAEGKLKTVDQVLLELSTRFADTADGLGKTAVASKLFGDKLGQDVIPFLNQGAAGLRDMQKEAGLFGQVFSTDAAKAAEQFNDNMERLGKIAQGTVNVFVQGVLPTMEAFSNALLNSIKNGGIMSTVMKELSMSAQVMGVMAKGSFVAMGELAKTVDHLIKLFVKYGETAVEAFKLAGSSAMGLGKIILEVAKGPFGSAALEMEKFAINSFLGLEKVKGKAKEAGDEFENGLTQKIIGAQKIMAAFAGESSVLESIAKSIGGMFSSMGGGSQKPDMKPPGGGGTGGDVGEVSPGGFTWKAIELEQEMLLRTQEIMLGLGETRLDMWGQAKEQEAFDIAQEDQRYLKRVEQIQGLVLEEEKGQAMLETAALEHAAKMEQIHRNSANAIRAQYRTMVDASASMMGSMAQLSQAFGKKGLAAYKTFATAQAIISMLAGATRAFADHPFPASAFIAGAVLAAGAANIAQIHSTGVAHAGLSNVPEEATYILQRGERVLAPQQNSDLTEFLKNGGGGGQPINIYVDSARWFEGITEATRNGQLIVHARAVV